jgi:hypothetical protein
MHTYGHVHTNVWEHTQSTEGKAILDFQHHTKKVHREWRWNITHSYNKHYLHVSGHSEAKERGLATEEVSGGAPDLILA